MSIEDWINGLLVEERLFCVEPPFRGDPVERRVLVSPEIWALIEGPWNTADAERRCSKLRADLEAIVTGQSVSVCLEPRKARDETLAYLDSPTNSVWDIRARDPSPAIRLLGQFPCLNALVALIPASRSVHVPYVARGPLGEYGSREWRDAISDCEHLFRSLFGPNEPMRGADIHAILAKPFDVGGA